MYLLLRTYLIVISHSNTSSRQTTNFLLKHCKMVANTQSLKEELSDLQSTSFKRTMYKKINSVARLGMNYDFFANK